MLFKQFDLNYDRPAITKTETGMSKHGQRVLITLRKMIANGELPPGERVAEIPIAERLGVSRTPVRIAFRTLEQEGLLRKGNRRGYTVRAITPTEIADAIEVRGVLEGLAARLASERGISLPARSHLIECLSTGDALFSKGFLTDEDMEAYHDFNIRFHNTIIEASRNIAIEDALSRNDHLPFASVSSIAFNRDDMTGEFRRFNFSHMQHHIIFDAIDNGQGARAEALMREHANAALRYTQILGPTQDMPDNFTVIEREDTA